MSADQGLKQSTAARSAALMREFVPSFPVLTQSGDELFQLPEPQETRLCTLYLVVLLTS